MMFLPTLKTMGDTNENKFICSSEKDGKIINMKIVDNRYSAEEYKRLWIDKGCAIECYAVPQYDFHDEKHLPTGKDGEKIIPKGKWAKKVQCVETGKIYSTIKSCMKEMKIGVFRMRNAIYAGAVIDGLHFRIIEDQ